MGQNKWFHEENLLMPLEAKTKEEAIEELGNLLLKNGYVKESFVPAVIAREKEFATGLPTSEIGVAIPHTDSHHVLKQAVAVGLLPESVKFCEMGDSFDAEVDVRLIFMLAVPDKDKVMTMLKQVMSVIQDPDFLKSIAQTSDRSKIAVIMNERLNAGTVTNAKDEMQTNKSADALEVKVTVEHPVGLHARPATLFVKAAAKYKSDISVFCEGRQGNAKSILKVLTLGANQGCEITIRAEGEDAQEALNELKELVASNFGGVE
ncbi:MAG: HPr family phosphocarrier protein [Pelolinea sp.]|nr:HPr family phosphocarrier protein [Pelolinea sp.]